MSAKSTEKAIIDRKNSIARTEKIVIDRKNSIARYVSSILLPRYSPFLQMVQIELFIATTSSRLQPLSQIDGCLVIFKHGRLTKM